MIDKVQKIREDVEKRYEYWREKEFNSHSIESEIRMSECQHLLLMLDSSQEEPVSEELDKEMDNYLSTVFSKDMDGGKPRFTTWFRALRKTAIHFANWHKEQMMKDATEAYIRRNRYTKQNVLNGFSVTCDAIQKFNDGDKVKVIVIKED